MPHTMISTHIRIDCHTKNRYSHRGRAVRSERLGVDMSQHPPRYSSVLLHFPTVGCNWKQLPAHFDPFVSRLNQGHLKLQSNAIPTELFKHVCGSLHFSAVGWGPYTTCLTLASPLLLYYSALFWLLLHRRFRASPADPQRELPMWQDICNSSLLLALWSGRNGTRLITSIGHGNNAWIKAEKGARMWHIRAAVFSGTDLIQSGSLIWSSLNPSWCGESFEELFSGAALVWWNWHMDSRRMVRHKCLLMAFILFVTDQSKTQKEARGVSRNDMCWDITLILSLFSSRCLI